MSHNEHFTASGQTMRVVSDNPADLRAVGVGGDIDGQEFRFVKRSLTVARYEAICGTPAASGAPAEPAPRTYSARRTGGGFMEKRRSIIDGAGTLIATTRGLPSGEIRIDPAPGATSAQRPEVELDLGFIAWALAYVDAPMRNLRLG